MRVRLRGLAAVLALAPATGCLERPPAEAVDLLADVVLVPSPAGSDAPGAFFLQRTEVTNAEYARFLGSSGYRRDDEAFLRHWRDAEARLPEPPEPPRGLANHPVVFVSLADAEAYASRRGMRLPSAAEWERAAASGVGGDYPFGFWQPLRANTLELGLDHTTPVGMFESGRSSLEVYDLCGNVAEWTVSEEGLELKGGSFKDDRSRARILDAQPVGAGWYLSSVCGFRCAQEASAYLATRVLDADAPEAARRASLAGMLRRGGARARRVLESVALARPDAEPLVRSLLR